MAGTSSNTSHIPTSYSIAKNNQLTRQQIEEYENESSTAVFVYGSLMLPNLAVRRLKDSVTEADELDLAQRMTPATLKRFRRHAVRDMVFPAIIDCDGEQDIVEGMVIFGLTGEELGRLDRFEAGLFARIEVSITIDLQDGTQFEHFVQVYLFAQDIRLLLDPAVATWSLEQFLETPEYSNLVREI